MCGPTSGLILDQTLSPWYPVNRSLARSESSRTLMTTSSSARNAKLDFGEVRPTAIRVGVELRHSQPEVLCNGAPTVLLSREVCARAET